MRWSVRRWEWRGFCPFRQGNGRPMHASWGRGQVLLTVMGMETGFLVVLSAVEHACACSTNAPLAALCFEPPPTRCMNGSFAPHPPLCL